VVVRELSERMLQLTTIIFMASFKVECFEANSEIFLVVFTVG
jgi:hypothetical protein